MLTNNRNIRYGKPYKTDVEFVFNDSYPKDNLLLFSTSFILFIFIYKTKTDSFHEVIMIHLSQRS